MSSPQHLCDRGTVIADYPSVCLTDTSSLLAGTVSFIFGPVPAPRELLTDHGGLTGALSFTVLLPSPHLTSDFRCFTHTEQW